MYYRVEVINLKKLMVLALCALFSFNALQAENTYPTNHNLLNPNHFDLRVNPSGGYILENLGYLEVKANTDYTLMMPDIYNQPNTKVSVTGSSGTEYINEVTNQLNQCFDTTVTAGYEDFFNIICSFKTVPNETGLRIRFEDPSDQLEMNVNFYEFLDYQLSEGSEPKHFVDYVGTLEAPTPPPPEMNQQMSLSYQWDESINLTTLINRHIKATDNVDGDVTDTIIIKADTYTTNERTLGSYDVLLEASDLSENKATLALNIQVVDTVAPSYTGPDVISIDYLQAPLDIETYLIEQGYISDDYDQTVTLNILSSNYNHLQTGDYSFEFELVDSSQNKSRYQITISIYSDALPIITGSNQLSLYLSQNYTLNQLLDEYHATDAITGEVLPVTIKSHTIPPLFDQVGTYALVIEATDQNMNTASKTIQVKIIDDIPPVFSFDDVLITELGQTLKDSEIFYYLKQQYEENDIAITAMQLISEDYSNNSHETGLYPYNVKLLNDDGKSFNHALKIAVNPKVIEETPSNNYWIYPVIGVSLVGLFIIIKRKGS